MMGHKSNQIQSQTRLWACTLLFLCGLWGTAWGIDPASGINSAGVINYPTAIQQTNDHTFHTTLEIVDLGEPDLRFQNIRYGYQLGDFQLLTDIHLLTMPDRELDYAEVRAKLRVLPIDEIRTDLALGYLVRYAEEEDDLVRIDNHKASLFLIVTTQAYLFGSYSLLTNFYLDNLNANLGLKLEVYQYILLALEADYLHSMPDVEDRSTGRLGLEIEGEQNFYFQIYYDDATEHMMFQLGSGF